MKPFIIALLLLLCITAAVAQPTDTGELLYYGYLNRDKNLVLKAIAKTRSALTKDKGSKDAQYQLALAEFALLNLTMSDKDEALYDSHEEETEDLIGKLIDDNDSWGEPRALLSAKLGFDMAYSPMKGMWLGAKSSSLMDKARKLSPESPLVWKLYGNSKLFTPETFGGDVNEAIKAYEQAIALYEKQQLDKGNWMYLDLLAFTGKAYEKAGQLRQAEEVYQKALVVEPGFSWVKNVLLPKLKEKSK